MKKQPSKKDNAKIKLWSVLHYELLDVLQKNGKIVYTENNHTQEWDKEYRWMAKQLIKRVGKPKHKGQYPIWAWYQYNDASHRKPDLRRGAHLPSGVKGIRIEFEKEASQVLLSDFVLWHYPLAYKCYIPDNFYDAREFDKRLKEAGLLKANHEQMPVKFKKEIEASWEKIFDLNFHNSYIADPMHKKAIQANLWEINMDEVLKIDTFMAR
jgi:Domain of unknown function (DUF3841)